MARWQDDGKCRRVGSSNEWFHDILRTTGVPYSEAEVGVIKCVTGRERSGAGMQHNAIYQFGWNEQKEYRWLDGRTVTGDVVFAPVPHAPYTGTRWRAIEIMAGVFAFQCLGAVEGNRWLDGRTHDGSVGLAPEPDHLHSGTRWQLCRVSENVYVLRCLGDIEGGRYLYGGTDGKSVGLAPHTGRGQHLGPSFTGAAWRVLKLGDG